MSDDTLADGAATGGVDTTKRAAETGQPGIFDSGDKPANDAGAAADTGADAGSINSSTADTSNTSGQNNQ
ncbi:MAG: hypothetical protein M3Z74_08605, partial [Pseudomonadota bacterium]|nr:hypothetical protein [Pseudomonadota bacterium]